MFFDFFEWPFIVRINEWSSSLSVYNFSPDQEFGANPVHGMYHHFLRALNVHPSLEWLLTWQRSYMHIAMKARATVVVTLDLDHLILVSHFLDYLEF
jgi:hypothetical protein